MLIESDASAWSITSEEFVTLVNAELDALHGDVPGAAQNHDELPLHGRVNGPVVEPVVPQYQL